MPRLNTMVSTFNPGIQKSEAGGFLWVWGQSGHKFQANQVILAGRPYVENKQANKPVSAFSGSTSSPRVPALETERRWIIFTLKFFPRLNIPVYWPGHSVECQDWGVKGKYKVKAKEYNPGCRKRAYRFPRVRLKLPTQAQLYSFQDDQNAGWGVH